MKITDKFTKPQIESIYSLLISLNDCNTNPLSSCKITGVSNFVDIRNNFICTYVMESWGESDGKKIEIVYRQIDDVGNVMDMKDIYLDEGTINESISKMEKIQI
jgi:hypothetical protein